jgi:hypothetical protein
MTSHHQTMKVIAHTTGSFQLIDNLSGDHIPHHRPAVVTRTSFISQRLAADQLVIVGEVPAHATDAEFAKHWEASEKDVDLAVQSFQATFGEAEAEADAEPAKPSRSKKTAAAE